MTGRRFGRRTPLKTQAFRADAATKQTCREMSLKVLLLHFSNETNLDLSYQHGWVKAFNEQPTLEVTSVNLARPRQEVTLLRELAGQRFDVVVALHSVFSNSRHLGRIGQFLVGLSGVPSVYFIGNEYKSMRDKMRFADRLRVRLFVTMNHDEEAVELYRRRLGCEVMSLPSGGLDPDLFVRGAPLAARQIQVGFRGFDEPVYFGHQERRWIAERTLAIGRELGWRCDISMEQKDRLAGEDWARFLRDCRCMIGTNSGWEYFDLEDTVRTKVLDFLDRHPDADFDRVYAEIFAHQPRLCRCRLITGRHVEAAASGTVQVLLRGDYSGYFEPDVHYIPVEPDFSNLKEALEASQDPAIAQPIADAAHEVVTTQLTYRALLNAFVRRVSQVI